MASETDEARPAHKRFQGPWGFDIKYLNEAETSFVYKEVFEDRVYLRHGVCIEEGDCVFDVGANIGLFTIFIQEQYKRTKVLAFEPSPVVYPILEANTAKYGGNVLTFQCGISSTSGEAVFTFYPSYSILSGFHADADNDKTTLRSGILNQWREKYPARPDPADRILEALISQALGQKREEHCRVRSISDILRETQTADVSLLKVDAEGSELEVLSGIAPVDWPKIRQVAMEIHDPGGTKVPRISATLEAAGFRCVFEEENHMRGSGVVNCYASRRAPAHRV